MANFLSISSAHLYVLSYDNKVTNLKAFFPYGFDIQITKLNLLDKWIIYKFNICIAINVKDYELLVYI